VVDPTKYFENVLSSLKAATKENLNQLRQPVDKNKSESICSCILALYFSAFVV